MTLLPLKEAIEQRFQQLCAEAGRRGIIGFVSVGAVRLLPVQAKYLQYKLRSLGRLEGVTAVSLGLFYQKQEILAVPPSWRAELAADDRWNDYARAYQTLNRLLNQFVDALAAEFGGIGEQATVEGWVERVSHVSDYFAHCVSHRTFAEAAGLGWRGRHNLIVTPEVGPALRFATLFVPGDAPQLHPAYAGCGDCHACLDACPILRRGDDYREACRLRLSALGLEDEVCGICVRVCWEHVTARLTCA